MKKYIELFRVKHYVKNGLIFLPLIFHQSFFNVYLLSKTFFGFLLFSLTASFIYIANDLADVKYDRLHEVKRLRPIASGQISNNKAKLLLFLVLLTIISLIILGEVNISSTLLLLLYGFLNLTYSFGLKNVALIDITIIAVGFVLRVSFGGLIANISISNWLLFTILSLSYIFALGKRRNELRKSKESRKSLTTYDVNFLDKSIYTFFAVFIVFYSLWTVSTPYPNFIYTIPVVILIASRYLMVIEADNFGDPVDIITNDKLIILFSLFYLVLIFVFIYF